MTEMNLLRRLMNDDPQRIAQFIGIYKTEIPKQLATLQAAVQADKFEEIAIIAHGIKSQSAYLEANDVMRLAKEIELEADAGNNSGTLVEKMGQLTNAIAKVIELL